MTTNKTSHELQAAVEERRQQIQAAESYLATKMKELDPIAFLRHNLSCKVHNMPAESCPEDLRAQLRKLYKDQQRLNVETDNALIALSRAHARYVQALVAAGSNAGCSMLTANEFSQALESELFQKRYKTGHKEPRKVLGVRGPTSLKRRGASKQQHNVDGQLRRLCLDA